MPKEKLCSKQPTCVNHNVSFVINLDALDDYSDIRADENGVWKRKGAPTAIISVHTRSQKPAQIAWRTRMKSLPSYQGCITTTLVLQIPIGLSLQCMVSYTYTM